MIGQNLKRLRLRAGLTQSVLASKVGINQGTLAKFERDVAQPSVGTILAFARALGIPAGRIFRGLPHDLKKVG